MFFKKKPIYININLTKEIINELLESKDTLIKFTVRDNNISRDINIVLDINSNETTEYQKVNIPLCGFQNSIKLQKK